MYMMPAPIVHANSQYARLGESYNRAEEWTRVQRWSFRAAARRSSRRRIDRVLFGASGLVQERGDHCAHVWIV